MKKLKLSQKFWDLIYPIGSICLFTNNINPSTLYGGTWERIKDTFLLACGNTYVNGSTGGSDTHKHLLPIAIDNNIGNWQSLQWNRNFGYGYKQIESPNYNNINNTPIGASKTMYQLYTEAESNIPPYLAVYVWKRIA